MERNRDGYISPLSTRYASKAMQYLFSENNKFRTWRRLWIALATAERERGRTAAFLEAYRAEAGLIYARYLTGRERTYYAPISDPPTYAAMEEMTLSTVERVKNRAVVEILTSEGRLDYRFKLVCEGGVWRINSYQ